MRLEDCVTVFICFISYHIHYAHSITVVGSNFLRRPLGSSFGGPGPPDNIYRAKISVTGYKHVMDVRFSKRQVFDVYNFRARWTEPNVWNDKEEMYSANRRYELSCWVKTHKEQRVIVHRYVPSSFTGYNEKLRFPPGMDLYLQCKVRPVNGFNMTNNWAFTNTIRAMDVPVYLPGLVGVNVKGLDADDIASILDNVAQEISKDYPVPKGKGDQDESGSGEEPTGNTAHGSQAPTLVEDISDGVEEGSGEEPSARAPNPSNPVANPVVNQEDLIAVQKTLAKEELTLAQRLILRRERQRQRNSIQFSRDANPDVRIRTGIRNPVPSTPTATTTTTQPPPKKSIMENVVFYPFRNFWQVEERELRRQRMQIYLQKLEKESNYDQDFRLLRKKRKKF